ncbi:MAG TPA: hypothetical protein PLW86_14110, partial [Rhodocyclaceae bacterium]|nr:hypothetical protein [Rhodocyclaceae bacterium]
PMPFPFLVETASGASITDIDGHELDDFCLGDTGSMFGHSPPVVMQALAAQASRGCTAMLANEDAALRTRLNAFRQAQSEKVLAMKLPEV